MKKTGDKLFIGQKFKWCDVCYETTLHEYNSLDGLYECTECRTDKEMINEWYERRYE